MKVIKLLRAISYTIITYQLIMYSVLKAGRETWYVLTCVLGFNALLYYIEAFRKEK